MTCTGTCSPTSSTTSRTVWTSSAERLRTFLRTICGLEALWTLCNRRTEGPNRPLTCSDTRGPGRARTDDSRGVNAVLYQLSYRPKTARTAVHKLLRPPTRTVP